MEKAKQMIAFHASSIRELTERANILNISKDDIVQIVSVDDGFILIYYSQQVDL